MFVCKKKGANQSSILSFGLEEGGELAELKLVAQTSSYDHMKIREIIAKMIIVHEYPFNMVEHLWFNVLMRSMNHNYEKVSRNTIKNECLQIYESEKEKLKKLLKNVARVSLTSDCWTSNQTLGYMCLTIHFIDDEWALQKRIISFCELEPPHSELVIADAMEDILLDWGLHDKVMTITLDNVSSNNVVARTLKTSLAARGNLYLEEIFHVRCCAHVLNLMVQDGLVEIDGVIHNIRESVKYLKKSVSRLHKFEEIARQMNISTKRGLCLDVPTRWNSTFNVLSSAILYESVFERYAQRDANYRWLPTSSDWARAKSVAKLLQVFSYVTVIFSGNSYPTANKFLPEVWKVKEVLSLQSGSTDLFIQSMASRMKEKFDKYWGTCNILMSIAAILDPRYKMELIDFCYPRIYPGSVDENKAQVLGALHSIFQIYSNENASMSIDASNSGDRVRLETEDTDLLQNTEGRDEFFRHMRSKIGKPTYKTDLEQYLEEGVVIFDPSRESQFDILAWWKQQSLKYQTLSRLARDIFSIPITTVASESAFSTGGRVLDRYRSSLAPKTIDALVCTSDWIRGSIKDITSLENDCQKEEDLLVKIPEGQLSM